MFLLWFSSCISSPLIFHKIQVTYFCNGRMISCHIRPARWFPSQTASSSWVQSPIMTISSKLAAAPNWAVRKALPYHDVIIPLLADVCLRKPGVATQNLPKAREPSTTSWITPQRPTRVPSWDSPPPGPSTTCVRATITFQIAVRRAQSLSDNVDNLDGFR